MIGAVILAAGASRRMGQPKLNLPWGSTTVLGQVISTFLQAGVYNIVVAAGDLPILGLPPELSAAVQIIHVPQNYQDSMLFSLQSALNSSDTACRAVFVALGDQPQIKLEVVQALISEYRLHSPPLLVPSFNHRRGHPWLVDRSMWSDLLSLDPSQTLRQFLNQHEQHIQYLLVQTDSILQDIDTPAEYARWRPDKR